MEARASFPRALERAATEVREGCYELLMVLAEAVSGQDPEQVDRALRILESAARLRPDQLTRLPHEESVVAWRSEGHRAGADRELARAEAPPRDRLRSLSERLSKSTSAIGYAEAIEDFEMALRQKPDHFWARCLQAICYHADRRSSTRPSRA